MANVRLPSYVNKRKLASGKTGYYWARPAWAKLPAQRNGRTCPIATTNLGTDVAEAIRKADAINDAFKQWRVGTDAGPVKGTVRWLFRWYRQEKRFKDLRAETRKGYLRMMDALEAQPMKSGGSLGDRRASAIDASFADKLYEKLRPGGERQATYKMSLCRAVWGWAARHAATTGVKENPFAGMKLRTKAEKGNRATTRAEYEAFKVTARAEGRQSMATAAALAFECCQRAYDVFGFKDPDGLIDRGIKWEGYLPGESINLVQSKTGNPVEIPLTDTVIVAEVIEEPGQDPRTEKRAEIVALYPELEEELARTDRHGGGVIVKDERTGKPYSYDYMQKVFRRLRVKAGLPAGMTFTGFRHGGITEVGSVEADVRPISGHTTLDVTRIYNKTTVEKARSIAAKRREHIALMTAGEGA